MGVQGAGGGSVIVTTTCGYWLNESYHAKMVCFVMWGSVMLFWLTVTVPRPVRNTGGAHSQAQT